MPWFNSIHPHKDAWWITFLIMPHDRIKIVVVFRFDFISNHSHFVSIFLFSLFWLLIFALWLRLLPVDDLVVRMHCIRPLFTYYVLLCFFFLPPIGLDCGKKMRDWSANIELDFIVIEIFHFALGFERLIKLKSPSSFSLPLSFLYTPSVCLCACALQH